VANGTETQPIHVLADDASVPWSYIRLLAGGTASFRHATLENGGNDDDPNGLGLFDVRGDVDAPNRQELLRLDHVTLKGSEQFGLSLRDNATLTADSDALTITGAKLGPIRTLPGLAGNIPAGSYTGNGLDEIVILGADIVREDTTWHERGVPYRVGEPGTANNNDVRVGDSADGAKPATLTVEAGVTVKVMPNGRILMSSSATGTTGGMVAVGTSSKPIVFTSAAAAPAPGDWVGLWFDGPNAKNQLDFVRVEYAGGPSYANSYHCDLQGNLGEAEDASILVFGEPPSAFVTHSTVANGAAYGIGRAWSGALVDFMPTNTFEGLGKCKQSHPRDKDGACPTKVECP
jgi:hypothetical protein